MTPLLLVAHGTRSGDVARPLADAVAARSGLDVRLAYADVRGPAIAEVVAGLPHAVVVPAFLAAGHHVRRDLPAQLAAAGAGAFPMTPAIGPDPVLAAAALDRLGEAGWRHGDPVVLAAAGSADAVALGQVRQAARLLQGAIGRRVRVGFAASAAPRVDALVAGLRATGERRISVATWLLSPGMFADRVAGCGADVVAAPLGTHPAVVDTILARYEAAVARAA
ncbi:sirohydrochlorin chelatase [Pseudonocardia sp. N23]|uniref:sirohydrochlorin chelatase n=1 Tax=Pseudonocardia sp. N23 TaxID=1987376 RepID=UPI000BFD4118|nr:CbiX/SirB N-terminal domain-containing protein [Pseudonocardia sp. N23]GAY07055.1 sirohydrochlorin ferrochelatase [Pseudonocardia sp. N23]